MGTLWPVIPMTDRTILNLTKGARIQPGETIEAGEVVWVGFPGRDGGYFDFTHEPFAVHGSMSRHCYRVIQAPLTFPEGGPIDGDVVLRDGHARERIDGMWGSANWGNLAVSDTYMTDALADGAATILHLADREPPKPDPVVEVVARAICENLHGKPPGELSSHVWVQCLSDARAALEAIKSLAAAGVEVPSGEEA